MVLFRMFNKKEHKGLAELVISGLTKVEHKNRGGRMYASDSSVCERKGTLNSTEIDTKTVDGTKYLFMESGKAAEKMILEGLDNEGVLLYADYKTPDIGINIGGRVDGIIYYNEKVYVLEIKQIGTLPSSPVKEHESQTMFYSAVLGLPAIIFYVDRKIEGFNTGLLNKEFVLDTSNENQRKYMKRVVNTSLYIQEKLIPNKPDYMKKSYCTHCNHLGKCWGIDTDFENWYEQGFSHETHENAIDINNKSDKIVEALMSKAVMKDRTTGVLRFLQKHGRDNAKKVLSGSWDNFYL